MGFPYSRGLVNPMANSVLLFDPTSTDKLTSSASPKLFVNIMLNSTVPAGRNDASNLANVLLDDP